MSINVSGITVQDDVTGQILLDDVSCQFEQGHITLITGASGAGKSTLLAALAGLVRPTSGFIEVGGNPLWLPHRPNPAVIRKLSVTFQSPQEQLFAATVEAEIRFSLRALHLPKSQLQNAVLDVLRAAELPPEVLDTSPLALSGGQQRRLAAACSNVGEPEWVLLDEPSAGLDAASQKKLSRGLLEKREQGIGIIVVSHHVDSLLEIADRAAILEGGHLVAFGTPGALTANRRVWLESHVGLSDAMQTRRLLATIGIAPEWSGHSAEQAATAIERAVRSLGKQWTSSYPAPRVPDAGDAGESCTPRMNPKAMPTRPSDASAPRLSAIGNSSLRRVGHSARAYISRKLDPRTEWGIAWILSIGTVTVHSVTAEALATIAVALYGIHAKTPWSRLTAIGKPLVLLALLSAAFSGLRWTPAWAWSAVDAVTTLLHIYPFLLTVVVGAAFTYVTRPFEVKSSIELMLRPLKRLHFPVDAFALTVGLALRFIPWTSYTLNRFQRIVQVRTKSASRKGRVKFRELPPLFVPLLMSLVAMAEDVALALQMRGYGQRKDVLESSSAFRMTKADTFAWIVTALFTGLIWWGP